MTANLPSEAAVEAAARAMYAAKYPRSEWDGENKAMKGFYRDRARVALSAALPLLPDVGDLLAEMDRLRAAMVMPDRDTITRAHVPVDTAFPNPWGCACGKSFRTGQQWSGHVIDAVWAVLPGRTEAQVKAEALREAADAWDLAPGGVPKSWLTARADGIADGGATLTSATMTGPDNPQGGTR